MIWILLTHEEGLVYSQDALFEECEDAKQGITRSKAAKHCFKEAWTFLLCIFLWRVPLFLFGTLYFFLPFLFQAITKHLNIILVIFLVFDLYLWGIFFTRPIQIFQLEVPAVSKSKEGVHPPEEDDGEEAGIVPRVLLLLDPHLLHPHAPPTNGGQVLDQT